MLLSLFPRKAVSFLVGALGFLALSGCTTVPPEAKAGMKKIVVLNAASSEVTRHHVGFTVFTNVYGQKSEMPELKTELNSLLRQELSNRLPGAQLVFDSANAQRLAGTSGLSKIAAVYASAAQAAKADTVIALKTRPYFPYGMPQGMTAEHGLWHGGSLQGGTTTVESYLSITVWDSNTGKIIGQGMPMIGAGTVEVPFPPKGSDYQGADRATVLKALLETITKKVTSCLDEAGL
jgi:hypothetical protein